MKELFFSFDNAKFIRKTATFSLPAGHTCPFARECLSRANKLSGKIIDGKHCRFRCYSASQEAYFPSIRRNRWHNYQAIKGLSLAKMTHKLSKALPQNTLFVRPHVGGDFFNKTYFLSWLNVAANHPNITFYAYTKALPFWVDYRDYVPKNFSLIASKGGTHDHLIKEYGLPYAEVVFSLEEAQDKGLEIDHDDSLAIAGDKPFALLLHGTQPANTPAATARKVLRGRGFGGYGRGLRQHNNDETKILIR